MSSDSEVCSYYQVVTKINYTFPNTPFSDPDKSIIFLLKMKIFINLSGILPQYSFYTSTMDYCYLLALVLTPRLLLICPLLFQFLYLVPSSWCILQKLWRLFYLSIPNLRKLYIVS